MRELAFEKLDVFVIAADLVGEAQRLIDLIPRGRSRIKDQLHRASTSVLLNIAEGAGEWSPAEKARFYRIALRSATECVGVFVVCTRTGWVEAHEFERARELVWRVVSALTKLVKSVEARLGA